MATSPAYLDSPFVNDGIGEQIKQRRIETGMSVRDLAKRAGVDRGRLAALEEGATNIRATTIAKVQTALDRFEHETGMDGGPLVEGEDGMVEFRVAGNFGVDVVVKGPVRDMAALEDSVTRLIAKMSAADPARSPERPA